MQTPYGGGYHDTGGKACQRTLDAAAQHTFHKEYTGRTQRGPQEREKQALRDFHGIHTITLPFITGKMKQQNAAEQEDPGLPLLYCAAQAASAASPTFSSTKSLMQVWISLSL